MISANLYNYHHLARIMQLTQTKLDAFVCVTEVIDDRIITHDMLNHKAEWQDAFPLGHFNNRYSIKGWKENITKELVVTGKANTKTFDSDCKHCEESQFAHFLNILSILEKNDVTAMTNLNLSNSNMDDCDASILAKLIRQGNLPNLKVLDVSGNQITATGEGFFTRALKNETVQDIIIFLYKFDQYSKLLAGSKLENDEAQIRVCWRDEIDESMAASRGSHKPDSPWRTNFEAMSLVVPIRKMGNNLGLPLRVEDYDEEITGTTQLENYKDSKI